MPRRMTSQDNYIVSLRRYIFRAPNPFVTTAIFLVVVVAIAYLLHLSPYNLLFLIVLPYLITVIADHLTIKSLRIYFPLRRIVALNIFAFSISFVIFLILWVFQDFNFAFFLAFAYMVDVRYIIYRTFLAERKNCAFIVSLYYNLAILVISLLYLPSFPLVPYLLSTAIFLLTGHIFISITTSIFRREFREDPLFFISSFVNYMGELRSDYVQKINRFFGNIYVDRRVPITTMVFRSKSGPKAIFVAPYVHPGPFGEIGGSDLPNKLERMVGVDNLMVFHTTTTHDNNIASDGDVEKIADVVRRSLEGDCEFSEMSDVLRGRVDGIGIFAQKFGNYIFLALIPENAGFDDVELETGLEIRKHLSGKYGEALLIDAHNCFVENAHPLSLTHSDMRKISSLLYELPAKCRIRMGFARKEFEGKSIGPGGIRAAVFDCDGKKIAYILMDGNNIKRGLRDRIREALGDLVDESEIFSTDNHIVNATMMDMNPVGEGDSWDEIVKVVRIAVEEAVSNIEEVCVHLHTEEVELRMASSGYLKRMTEITKGSVRIAKILTPILFIGGVLVSYLVFLLLS